jgi:hypothetical protein
MNTKTSDRHDLYLHLRARAYRLECAIITEQCCAGYKPLTDTEYEALGRDLERVEVEMKQIEKGMSAVELAIADAEAEDIEEQIFDYWADGPRPGQTPEN